MVEPSRLQSGQVWRYRHRPGDEDSTIVILEVTGGTAHIHVRDLLVTTSSGAVLQEMFVPISAAVLETCLTEQLPALDEAALRRARQTWLDEHDTRDKGEFTVPVDRFLDLVENRGESGPVN
jgi:hypothetical protein